jgi:phosphomannomutase
VVTPVSSNTAVERSGWFETVLRTRIGSPFVIEGMQELVDRGIDRVVGYEANGGFLLATDIEQEGRILRALPTRDAVLVAIAILRAAVEQGKPVSALSADLPPRFTRSDRLKDFPTEIARRVLPRSIAAILPGTRLPRRRCSAPLSVRSPLWTRPTA